MAIPQNRAQMEAYIKSAMDDCHTRMPDAVYGLMAPRFVRCDYEARTFEAAIQAQPWMRNSNDVMHGGVIASALDGMGGQLARCYVPSGTIAPTCSLSVSYLLPVPMDAELHVRMHATHTGHRMLFVSGEAIVFDGGDERLCATSTAIYAIVA